MLDFMLTAIAILGLLALGFINLWRTMKQRCKLNPQRILPGEVRGFGAIALSLILLEARIYLSSPPWLDATLSSVFTLLALWLWLYFAYSLKARLRIGMVLIGFERQEVSINMLKSLLFSGGFMLAILSAKGSDNLIPALAWSQLAWLVVILSMMAVMMLSTWHVNAITDKGFYYATGSYQWHEIKSYHWLRENESNVDGHDLLTLNLKRPLVDTEVLSVPSKHRETLKALLEQKVIVSTLP